MTTDATQCLGPAPYGVKPSELLADYRRWTRSFYALDHDGDLVCGDDQRAVCFCVLGAIRRYVSKPDPTSSYYGMKPHCGSDADDDYRDAVDRLGSIVDAHHPDSNCGVGGWNDDPETKHDEVLRLLKEAGL
jgi:hypothetical protein